MSLKLGCQGDGCELCLEESIGEGLSISFSKIGIEAIVLLRTALHSPEWAQAIVRQFEGYTPVIEAIVLLRTALHSPEWAQAIVRQFEEYTPVSPGCVSCRLSQPGIFDGEVEA